MRYVLFLILLLTIGCEEQPAVTIAKEDWFERKADLNGVSMDTLILGKSYLSVYAQIYSFTQKKKYNLTAMVSLRNVSEQDTIYLLRADYFNTAGTNIRSYLNYPIFILPMETLEIVIAQEDVEGGTGSNFLFEWKVPKGCPEPLFEGVMNSMQGTQGISFITQAKRIE